VSQKVTTPAITLGANDLQTTLNNKADKAGTTFTGTVVAPTITLGSTDLQTTLNNKADKAGTTFTGTVAVPSITLNGTSLQTTLNNKADKAGTTFTGTVVAPTITLGSTDLQTTLNNKADKAGTTFTGTVVVPSITLNGTSLQTTLNGKQSTIQTTDGTKRNTDFGNYQRVQTELPNIIIQRQDSTGTSFTDAWRDQIKLEWNDSTKKTTTTIYDKLIAGEVLETPAITLNGTSLQTTLNNKADKLNPTFSGTTALLGDVSIGTATSYSYPNLIDRNLTLYGNLTVGKIFNITGNTQVTVDSQLAVNNDLLVDTIRANNPTTALVTFVDQCAIGTTASNKPLTVNGSLTAKAALVQNDLSVSGNLSVTGFYPHKPYVAFYFTGGQISTSNVPGFVPRANITMDPRNNNELYAFTFSPAHPNGTNYMVMVTARTGSSSTYFYCTANATANNRFLVWCRTSPNALVNGEYYVQTIP